MFYNYLFFFFSQHITKVMQCCYKTAIELRYKVAKCFRGKRDKVVDKKTTTDDYPATRQGKKGIAKQNKKLTIFKRKEET